MRIYLADCPTIFPTSETYWKALVGLAATLCVSFAPEATAQSLNPSTRPPIEIAIAQAGYGSELIPAAGGALTDNVTQFVSEEPTQEEIVIEAKRQGPVAPPEAEIRREEDPLDWNRQIKRETRRVEIAFHVLSLVDGVATLHCLGKRTCHELNPIYGRNPSALRLIGTKAALGFVHHWLIERMLDRDPRAARRAAYISLGIQSAVTGITVSRSF